MVEERLRRFKISLIVLIAYAKKCIVLLLNIVHFMNCCFPFISIYVMHKKNSFEKYFFNILLCVFLHSYIRIIYFTRTKKYVKILTTKLTDSRNIGSYVISHHIFISCNRFYISFILTEWIKAKNKTMLN